MWQEWKQGTILPKLNLKFYQFFNYQFLIYRSNDCCKDRINSNRTKKNGKGDQCCPVVRIKDVKD